jgi:predicted DNA-binding WGR domain protein
MNAVCLRRVDPARNMSRFYRLDVQPDLFGGVLLMKEWGRIGRPGQMRQTPYPSLAEAQAALERQQRTKERRGYSKLGEV